MTVAKTGRNAEIVRRHAAGETMRSIAESLGMNRSSVSRIISRTTPEGREAYLVRERASQRRRYEKHRDRILDKSRDDRHGLEPGRFQEMLTAQGGGCAICGKTESTVRRSGFRFRLHVDHCHASGRIRGVLCDRCNNGLAGFRDDPDLLRKAIQYLAGAA